MLGGGGGCPQGNQQGARVVCRQRARVTAGGGSLGVTVR